MLGRKLVHRMLPSEEPTHDSQMPQEAARGVASTWQRILAARHPDLAEVRVSVVEPKRQRLPAPAASSRKLHALALPDDAQSRLDPRAA